MITKGGGCGARCVREGGSNHWDECVVTVATQYLLNGEARYEVSHTRLLVDLLRAHPGHKDGLLLLAERGESIGVTELCAQGVDDTQLKLVHLLPWHVLHTIDTRGGPEGGGEGEGGKEEGREREGECIMHMRIVFSHLYTQEFYT